VLILAPYKLTKNEYEENINHDKDKEFKYLMNLIGAILKKLLLSIDKKITYNDFILKFYSACKDEMDKYEAVLLDETDFFLIQSMRSTLVASNKRLFEQKVDTFDRFPPVDSLIELFSRGLAKSDAVAISISANPLYIPPSYYNELKENGYDGDEEIVNTVKLDLKSNLNLENLYIIRTDNKIRDSIRLHNYLVKSRDRYTLFYKAGKFTKEETRALKKHETAIIMREENIEMKHNRKKFKSTSPLDDYPWLYFVDEENLSDNMYDKHQHVAVNVSSSRSVSLLKTDKKAAIVIQADNINASVTQVMGRFRKAKTDVYLLLPLTKNTSEYEERMRESGLDKELIKDKVELEYEKTLTDIDPFLNFKRKEVYFDMNDLPFDVDVKCSQRDGHEEYMTLLLMDKGRRFSSLNEIYEDYINECQVNNHVPYSKGSFRVMTDGELYNNNYDEITIEELTEKAISFWEKSRIKRVRTVWENWEYKKYLSFRKFSAIIKEHRQNK
jgi:hypothetical protein